MGGNKKLESVLVVWGPISTSCLIAESMLRLIFYLDFLLAGTREAAFTYAIISAGVTHRVTHACSLGNLSECHCDNSRKGQKSQTGWKWGGCSVDIGFGEKLADRFMTQSGHDRVINLMNTHNSRAGREVSSPAFITTDNDIIAFLITS